MADQSSSTVEVAIADDETLALDRLARCLGKLPNVRVVAQWTNGDEVAESLRRGDADVYFLDIRMPGANLFETLGNYHPDRRPVVVFVTAHDDFAIQAFEVEAVDYILKPVEADRLAEVLRRIRRREMRPIGTEVLADLRRSGSPWVERLLVESAGVERVLAVGDIETLEAARNYVRLHPHRGERSLIRRPLTRLERELDPRRFVRIHRSTIVNLDWVRQIEPWFSGDAILVMASGAKQRMSRRFRDRFYRQFGAAG